MKSNPVRLLLTLACAGSPLSAQSLAAYLDPKIAPETRITDLLSRMTRDEKIAVFGATTEVPRLNVPDAGRSEGLHGLMQHPYVVQPGTPPISPTAQFAQVVGMGRKWDPALIGRAARVQAEEARWLYNSDRYHRAALVVWGLNAELMRDPAGGASTSRTARIRSTLAP